MIYVKNSRKMQRKESQVMQSGRLQESEPYLPFNGGNTGPRDVSCLYLHRFGEMARSLTFFPKQKLYS